MEGFEVVTSDDEKVGHVVGTVGENLIVEHGTIFKSRHALPRTFAHVDEAERIVRATISKALLEDSPKVSVDDVDEHEVARYYGLAEAATAPATEGLGETVPGDPAETAEEQGLRAGIMPPAAERAQLQGNTGPGQGPNDNPSGRQIIPPDSHR